MAEKIDILPIIKIVSNETHKKGLEYFFWKRPEMLVFDESYVHAKVRGSGQHSYDVEIRYYLGTGKVSSTECTCPAFRSGHAPCKHIVATLYLMKAELSRGFEPPAHEEPAAGEAPGAADPDDPDDAGLYESYEYEPIEGPDDFWGDPDFDGKFGWDGGYFGNRGSRWPVRRSIRNGESRARATSSAARKLLSRAVSRFVGKAEAESAHAEPVGLEPTLCMDHRTGTYLKFKVGASRKYIIKDLADFKEGFYYNQRYELGRSGSFILDRRSFDEAAVPLLDFFLNGYTPAAVRYGYADKRNWVLSFEQAEAFIGLMEGGALETDFYGVKRSYGVVRGNYPLRLKAAAESGGLELTNVEKYEIITGAEQTMVAANGNIHICTEEYADACEELLIALYEADGKLFFAKDDAPLFLGTIAGKAEEFLDIEYEGGIENKAPPPLVTKVYFDAEDDGRVTAKMIFSYGGATHPAFERRSYKEATDRAAEIYAENTLQRYMGTVQAEGGALVLLPGKEFEEKLYELVARGVDEIRSFAEVYASESFDTIKVRAPKTATVGVRIEGNLLRVDFDVEGVDYAELAEVINSYKKAKKYHRLRDGSLLSLEDDSLAELSEIVNGLDVSDNDIASGTVRLDANRALYIDAMMKKSEELRYNRDARFRSIIRSVRDVADADFVVPARLENVLRNYQKTGYEWLRTLDSLSFGGILADDMGLGKTLQVLALLQAIKDEGAAAESAEGESSGAAEGAPDEGAGAADAPPAKREQKETKPRPSIVVCPASLVLNWESEAAKFTPRLTTAAVAGAAAERKKQIRKALKRDVIFTSYDLLKRDIEQYEPVDFRFVIIDEAQYIKNQNTQNAKAVKLLKGTSRIALTGTPVENSLAELWSIFDFLMPGYLYSYNRFRQKYETRITKKNDETAAERLRALVRPFILRRLKSNVLKELPEKIESVSYAPLYDEQRKLYVAALSQAKKDLSEKLEQAGAAQSRIMILAALTRLRQICCDPVLVYSGYGGGSAKLDACVELVESCIEGGHRMLLFSQFTSMIALIEERLHAKGIPYYLLTGATSKKERLRLVNSFNDGDTPVFLISLKAGGTGLNLTGADIVIHYDPWWNVSAQNQATDRTHRIGQTNTVQVFKLIAKDTIEERILDMQAKKAALADSVIEEGGGELAALSEEELLSLFS